MGYTSGQISEILLKSDRTMYKIGVIAYDDMFSEDNEALDYERDIIFIYKKAVEYADDFYVGTDKLDKTVERLATKIAVYDYGTLTAIYNDVASFGLNALQPGIVLNDLDDVTISNLLNNQLLRYNASTGQWVNVGPGAAVRNTQSFVATAGQTTFVTAYPFDAGLHDIFLNGVKLNTSSYTTFGDYTFILNDAAVVDDIIDITIYDASTSMVNPVNSLNDLADVNLGPLVNKQALYYNSSTGLWENALVFVPYTGAVANVDLGEFEMKAGQFTLDTSPTGTATVGTTRWNNTIGSSETTLKGGSVILKNGVDLVARVVNKVTPNTTLTKANYPVVRVSGAQGQRLAIAYAQANNDNNSADTLGLVIETIATNQEGFIMTVGQIENINTTGALQGETWVDGDVLYLSPTIPGAITNVKPVAPQHIVIIGYVEYAHQNNGKIYVKVMNGWELGELHDVDTTGAVAGQVLKYNGTIWAPSSDAGITGSAAAGQVAYFTGATTQAGSNNLFWDTTNLRLGIRTTTPLRGLEVGSDGTNWISGVFAGVGGTNKVVIGNLSGNAMVGGHGSALTGWVDLHLAGSNLVLKSGGDTERARFFSATGNFGINTGATDSGQRLQVIGTGYFSDSVGIGSTSLTGFSLRVNKNINGAATSYGVRSDGIVQSDVSGQAIGFDSSLGTQAASFTLPVLTHYRADQSTFGAGSTITTQYGFQVRSNLIGATNNYGFFGDIAAATGRWNLYMNGTANNYMAGSLGIGSTSLTGHSLRVSKTITGAATSYGLFLDGQAQSDVTGAAVYVQTNANTQAATFTMGNLYHFIAAQGTFGAGTTVATQRGFLAASSLIGATNNFGFDGQIPAGAGRWNLYMQGTADNYLAGSLGIGSTSLTAISLLVSKNISGSALGYGIHQNGQIQSGVNFGLGIANTPSIAASLTISSYRSFYTANPSIGAASTVGELVGYFVESNFVGGTATYGFQSAIPSGTGRWNLYMNGTANNYMAGSLGIGTTALTGVNLYVLKPLTGSNQSVGVFSRGTILSDVTATASYFRSFAGTDATTFTLSVLRHYSAEQTSFGAGSTVSDQMGYLADSTLIGATNNYGFYGNIAAATGRWNLYMNGTANNYMAGQVAIGHAVVPDPAVAWQRALVIGNSGTNKIITGYLGSATSGATLGAVNSALSAWADLNIAGSTLIFRSNGETEAMRIFSSRNLGIGTGATDSGEKLQVTGTMKVTGATLQTGTGILRTENSGINAPSGSAGVGAEIFVSGGKSWYTSFNRTTSAYAPISLYGSVIDLSGGNVLIGSTSDSGEKLQVTGTAKITGDTLLKGSGATSATIGLTVQDSASTNLLRVRNDGSAILRNGLYFGTSTNNLIVSSNAANTIDVAGLNFNILFGSFETAGYGVQIGGFNASTRTVTSGASGTLNVAHGYAPTSGTGTYTMLQVVGTINQTGGANGITRGLYINPTLTAAADWRSIEWSNNSGWGLYGAGTSANYLGGRTSIGILPTTLWSQYSGVLQIGQIWLLDYQTAATAEIASNTYYDGTNNRALRTAGASSISFQSTHIGLLTAASVSAGAIQTLTEKARLTNIGNLLIGSTSDTGEKLQVTGTAKITGYTAIGGNLGGANQRVANFRNSGGNAFIELQSSGAGAVALWAAADNQFAIYQNATAGTIGTNVFYINASGNLGLGVTPSAWSVLRGLQVGLTASVSGYAATTEGAFFSSNSFYNGAAFVYQITGSATQYLQINGQHRWSTAASGTAAANITFTQAMTLDASGNLGVGTTSPNYRLEAQVNNSTLYDPANTLTALPIGFLYNTSTTAGVAGTLRLDAGVSGGNAVATISAVHVGSGSAALTFGTRNAGGNTTERARITQLGNLHIGTFTSDSGEKLQVTGTAKITGNFTGGAIVSAAEFRLNNNSFQRIALGDASGGFAGGYNLDYSSGSVVSHAATGAIAGYRYASNGAMFFFTGTSQTAGTTATVRMTLDASGNLLLGMTTAPSDGAFAIKRTGSAAAAIKFHNASTGDSGTDGLYIGLGGSDGLQGYIFHRENTQLIFATNAIESFRIQNTQNISIGATSDTGEKLQVTGTAKITGNMQVGSSAPTSITGYTSFAVGNATNGGNIDLFTDVTRHASWNNTATETYFGTRSNTPLIFTTNATDVGRFFANGDFRVGVAGSVKLFVDATNNRVGIGTATVNASAKFQVDSTTSGFLPPRMTTTERNAISTPDAGLLVYDTTDNKHYGYNGTTWNAFY